MRSPDQMINAHAKPSTVSDFLTDNDTAIHAFKNLTWRDVLNYIDSVHFLKLLYTQTYVPNKFREFWLGGRSANIGVSPEQMIICSGQRKNHIHD